VLLESGAKRGAVDKDRRTALHYVAFKCADDAATKVVDLIVKELVTTARRRPEAVAAFVNRQDSKGKTALHLAAHHGQLTAVRSLINCNADVSVRDKLGCTPLHAAASAKDVDEVSDPVLT